MHWLLGTQEYLTPTETTSLDMSLIMFFKDFAAFSNLFLLISNRAIACAEIKDLVFTVLRLFLVHFSSNLPKKGRS